MLRRLTEKAAERFIPFAAGNLYKGAKQGCGTLLKKGAWIPVTGAIVGGVAGGVCFAVDSYYPNLSSLGSDLSSLHKAMILSISIAFQCGVIFYTIDRARRDGRNVERIKREAVENDLEKVKEELKKEKASPKTGEKPKDVIFVRGPLPSPGGTAYDISMTLQRIQSRIKTS